MKSIKYTIITLSIAFIIIFITIMPRFIEKEGYIYRTIEDVKYVDSVEKYPNGGYIPTNGNISTSVEFDQNYQYLYKLLNNKSILRLHFQGIYYPISIIWRGIHPIRSKIVINKIINVERLNP
jgi:hypothetical protein